MAINNYDEYKNKLAQTQQNMTKTVRPTTMTNPLTRQINPLLPSGAQTANKGPVMRASTIGNVGTANVTQPNQPPNDWSKQLEDRINNMYNAQQQQRLQEFYNARDKQVGNINEAKGQLGGIYGGQRNQADVVSMQNMARMKEQMANQGLYGSGENVTANIQQNMARQQALANITQAENKERSDYDKQISELNDPNNELKIKNEIGTERSRALYEAFLEADERNFRDKQYDRGVLESDRDYNRQVERDKMSDTQWKAEFDQGKLESDREFQQRKDEFAKTYKLDMDKFLYDKKVTEREWAGMSPAEKEKMALSYSYDLKLKKASGGGGGGGGTTGTKGTTSKTDPQPYKAPAQGTKDQFMKPKEQSSAYDMKMYKALYGEKAWTDYLNSLK